jgi:hypothetical protein
MITLLQKKGFRLTNKDTLSNREFRKLDSSFEQSETMSTFDYPVFDVVESFELHLGTKTYRESALREILDLSRTEGRDDLYMTDMDNYIVNDYIKEQTGYDDISVEVESDERGYWITFTTTKQGVT